jgi:hypothetical protein
MRDDLRLRIADATADTGLQVKVRERDEQLREAAEAQARTDAARAVLREAAGQTIDSDEANWRKISEDSRRDLSALTQSRMQELGIYLWESNLVANRLIELPLSYILAEGVRLVADDETVQSWLDAFWRDPINQMDLKLPRKCRELALFGEQCYPAFVNELNGHVRLGYLDPSRIETVVVDPDNGEQPIGIVTRRDAHGRSRKYRIIVNGPERELFTQRTQRIREGFDSGECFYFNINNLSNGTRGRSDLIAHIDWLDQYDQYLFGELERQHNLRAFIWDVTLSGATPEEVAARARQIAPPRPNSVRVHNDSEKWTAESPGLQAGDSSETARLFRNHLLGGSTIPEHWFGGASDVNRATGDSMGEPTFKQFIMRQTFIGYMLESMGAYVIRRKELAETGKEPDLLDGVYKISAQWPEMVARDTTKYASALAQVAQAVAMAVDRGLMTDETAIRVIENISGRLGVEFDAEAEIKNARLALATKREQDVFHTPPDGAPNISLENAA